ncbi:unnamed protein product [Vitrella brassicaformis CCMP3155]|uniref:Uncharacterized protein n=1 Tax=Vitrella brassicaformis (strain CCMP3155) TaxID=1169540 RepID=A0A0G4H5T9_VITBC|nr:unnamed protein product [Vitrella brassicaformis CCMP3155]|eukprot:CEM39044.1 unnamed protein product [Vitrella brassicaformis CCMP3155]
MMRRFGLRFILVVGLAAIVTAQRSCGLQMSVDAHELGVSGTGSFLSLALGSIAHAADMAAAANKMSAMAHNMSSMALTATAKTHHTLKSVHPPLSHRDALAFRAFGFEPHESLKPDDAGAIAKSVKDKLTTSKRKCFTANFTAGHQSRLTLEEFVSSMATTLENFTANTEHLEADDAENKTVTLCQSISVDKTVRGCEEFEVIQDLQGLNFVPYYTKDGDASIRRLAHKEPMTCPKLVDKEGCGDRESYPVADPPMRYLPVTIPLEGTDLINKFDDKDSFMKNIVFQEDPKLRAIRIVRNLGVKGNRFSILGVKVASSVKGKFFNPKTKEMEEEKPAYIALQADVWIANTEELKENEHFALGFGKQAITMGLGTVPTADNMGKFSKKENGQWVVAPGFPFQVNRNAPDYAKREYTRLTRDAHFVFHSEEEEAGHTDQQPPAKNARKEA